MHKVTKTFLELAAFDEVYPNERQVLAYIIDRLTALSVPYQQDKAGNIVAAIKGRRREVVALAGHVDIAAPLMGREVQVESDIIKTDGKSLLGGDDKTAVAVMLELADFLQTQKVTPANDIELIFTIGEESGLQGAQALDYGLVHAKEVLVFDWMGSVNRIITKSPCYVCIDVAYEGKDAHPAEWQQGKNAGAALMQVASALRQGEYRPKVTFNIGMVQVGNARNKVPGHAELKAEVRSFDAAKASDAAEAIRAAFVDGAEKAGITANVEVAIQAGAYALDTDSVLLARVSKTLGIMKLSPFLEQTYGCFDGNVFTAKGMDVVILGAAYYHPHGPEEYVKISELEQLYEFAKLFVESAA